MTASLHQVALPHLDDITFPSPASSVTQLSRVMDLLSHQISSTSPQDSDSHTTITLNLVLHLLIAIRDSSSSSITSVLWFICEQLRHLINSRQSYSPDFLIFASVFYNVSPHAYRFIRDSGKLVLPSYSTVRRITVSSAMSPSQEQSSNTFLHYVSQKFKSLSSSDYHVNLLIDEIHLRQYFDYVGGQVVGSAHNTMQAATTAFAFMITSVFSNMKEVVHVMPSCKMSGETLFDMTKRTIIGLERIGFKVIAVITDNNKINSKAMSFFSTPPSISTQYPHPSDASRPLFFLFDCVHVFKCVRNNWLNLKNEMRSMVYPSSIFIDVITRWWQIVNVKTPSKGDRLRNLYAKPLTLNDSPARQFLLYFLGWLKKWKDMDCNGKLTRETHFAISHTTEGLLKISDYCLHVLKAKYVLLGKFQTDSLEARFGQYRQLAGGPISCVPQANL